MPLGYRKLKFVCNGQNVNLDTIGTDCWYVTRISETKTQNKIRLHINQSFQRLENCVCTSWFGVGDSAIIFTDERDNVKQLFTDTMSE